MLHGSLQVLYGLRTMFNVRNGQDLAQFLADPQREEFDSHSSHLSRIQVQRASCQQHVDSARGAVLAGLTLTSLSHALRRQSEGTARPGPTTGCAHDGETRPWPSSASCRTTSNENNGLAVACLQFHSIAAVITLSEHQAD